MAETVEMSDEIEDCVAEHAPELDASDVREVMAEHEKPTSEPGTHLEWATEQLRRSTTGRPEGRPALEIVEAEMRRDDESRE
jgi:hypothetical protein